MRTASGKTHLWTALAGVLLVGAAIGVSVYLARTRPAAGRQPAREMAVPVRVMTASAETARLPVEAHGEVIPARQVELTAEAPGRIIERNARLEAGGRLAEGAAAVTIDPRDYTAAVAQAEANLERARLELALERSRARIAVEEWRRVGAELAEPDAESRALTLREPQIAAAESARAAAEAARDRARWNLDRTVVRAPFDALVLDRQAEVGQIALAQTRLASLVAADEFHVRISLPADHLRWVRAPDADGGGGAPARVFHDLGNGRAIERAGRVVRVLGDLDPAGRTARALIAVPRPLDPPEEALRLRAYVRVVIEGPEIEGVFRLPISAFREGGFVWVANGEDRLEIRPVELLWQDREQVWIAGGIENGERVVISRIATPIPALQLRIEGADAKRETVGGKEGP